MVIRNSIQQQVSQALGPGIRPGAPPPAVPTVLACQQTSFLQAGFSNTPTMDLVIYKGHTVPTHQLPRNSTSSLRHRMALHRADQEVNEQPLNWTTETLGSKAKPQALHPPSSAPVASQPVGMLPSGKLVQHPSNPPIGSCNLHIPLHPKPTHPWRPQCLPETQTETVQSGPRAAP